MSSEALELIRLFTKVDEAFRASRLFSGSDINISLDDDDNFTVIELEGLERRFLAEFVDGDSGDGDVIFTPVSPDKEE